MKKNTVAAEQKNEKRFGFGKNWLNFITTLDDQRINVAIESIKEKLNVDSLEGKTFLDIGCGSGLFSLAARRMGAKVVSFDYDKNSVACAQEIKKKFYNDDSDWIIMQGSALDKEFIQSLGKFDIVYSWGVLHHTGDMWTALEYADLAVKPGGTLFISLYNNQGRMSKVWLKVKQAYCSLPSYLRFIVVLPSGAVLWGPNFLRDFLRLTPFKSWTEYKKNRGMSAYHDLIDWVGGLPFEVSTPEEIFRYYRDKGYSLKELKTCRGGLGCNEFVFGKK
ncbi:MAG: SAM-dependent methyltransferase [Rickettsiales bacterium]|nr:SAM-dependent methyltransferase [Rickettsiales bacterium]|tara:strand:+ start:8928 stop:9758 length:831 start_codon:yes stop_codon:yes gene_type:complete